ncbi:MAG TPA: choice-of-anchor tandem repeat GloVer-containing protein, partial [Verrucomicrobiae bacterium]|nr:choice-of-anchor tandem repeat GloVer-containing protein [Verrucomicrobiae bacterium]
KISPTGLMTMTPLVTSPELTGDPRGRLLLLDDGNFYGTTANGGDQNTTNFSFGTIFRMSPSGDLVTLHNFFTNPDPETRTEADAKKPLGPEAGLVLGSDGKLYGTTRLGGDSNHGTVFRFLIPPIEPPTLAIRKLDPQRVLLSWPTIPAGFSLESSPILGSGSIWTNYISQGALMGTDLFVTNYIPERTEFFRLRKQAPSGTQPR